MGILSWMTLHSDVNSERNVTMAPAACFTKTVRARILHISVNRSFYEFFLLL